LGGRAERRTAAAASLSDLLPDQKPFIEHPDVIGISQILERHRLPDVEPGEAVLASLRLDRPRPQGRTDPDR
jgi:hypothetical protein